VDHASLAATAATPAQDHPYVHLAGQISILMEVLATHAQQVVKLAVMAILATSARQATSSTPAKHALLVVWQIVPNVPLQPTAKAARFFIRSKRKATPWSVRVQEEESS
jgi:hypothetical protein